MSDLAAMNRSEWRSWNGAKQRCTNPKASGYAYYGGRGIGFCERWNSFKQFLNDMGPKPDPSFTLDRIDSDGDYGPGNCRWATRVDQIYNRRLGKYSAPDPFRHLNDVQQGLRETFSIVGLSVDQLTILHSVEAPYEI